jgi:hypothetical protein
MFESLSVRVKLIERTSMLYLEFVRCGLAGARICVQLQFLGSEADRLEIQLWQYRASAEDRVCVNRITEIRGLAEMLKIGDSPEAYLRNGSDESNDHDFSLIPQGHLWHVDHLVLGLRLLNVARANVLVDCHNPTLQTARCKKRMEGPVGIAFERLTRVVAAGGLVAQNQHRWLFNEICDQANHTCTSNVSWCGQRWK